MHKEVPWPSGGHSPERMLTKDVETWAFTHPLSLAVELCSPSVNYRMSCCSHFEKVSCGSMTILCYYGDIIDRRFLDC